MVTHNRPSYTDGGRPWYVPLVELSAGTPIPNGPAVCWLHLLPIDQAIRIVLQRSSRASLLAYLAIKDAT